MKKRFLALFNATIMGLGMVGFSACQPIPTGNNSTSMVGPQKENATAIYMSCYAGGFGSAWIRQAAVLFNERFENYEVVVLPDHKDSTETTQSKIASDTTPGDVFLGDQNIRSMINQDMLMDLTSLYTTQDENGQYLEDRIIDPTDWQHVTKRNGKYYAVPHNDSLISAVADYGLFEEKGWLMYDDNGNISAGRDGVSGTYDDGLPVTVDDWNELIENIIADPTTCYPYIYSGKYYFYANFFLHNIWAQYTGVENYKLNYTFNGDFYSVDANATTGITTENGYVLYEIDKGREKAIEWAAANLTNKLYTHPKSFLSTSHTDVQNYFVLGHKNAASNPRSAILFDGIWWQNEARPIFNSCEEANDKDYAYGVHDYRIMLAPIVEGSYGLDGQGNGAVLSCNENCVIYAKKQSDPKKEEVAKAWVQFLTSDEVSKLFTLYSGGVRPYKYSLTDTEYASLDPFTKSVWDVYSDYDNVKIVRNYLLKWSNDINSIPSSLSVDPLTFKVNGITYTDVVPALRANLSAEKIMKGFTDLYSKTAWDKAVSELK